MYCIYDFLYLALKINNIMRNKESYSSVSIDAIEWMLKRKELGKKDYIPEYGDLGKLNKDGLILTAVGKEALQEMVSDYLDLLETSAAVYERNGDYALGIFSSGWCQLMDVASRKLCNTTSNTEALRSGKWLCHDSCWKDASLKCIETGKPVDIDCRGGIRLYAVPIIAGGIPVGTINMGYGDPPQDPSKLHGLSETFNLPLSKLRKQAKAYVSRPAFIIELAKQRIESVAKHIGAIVEQKQAETAVRESENKLRKEKDRFAKIVLTAPGAICSLTQTADQLFFSYVDTGIEQLFGLPPGMFAKDASAMIRNIHPDDVIRVREKLNRSASELVMWNCEFRYKRNEQDTLWIETRFIPEQDTDGSITWYGYFFDITGKKQNQIKEQVLFGIATATLTTGNLEDLSRIITEKLSPLIDTSNFYIALYDNHTETFSIPYWKDEQDNIETWPAAQSLTGHIIHEKKSMLLTRREIIRLIKSRKIKQVGTMCEIWLGVPLIIEETIIGVIAVQNYDNPDAFNEESKAILEFVSNHVSLAIQRQKSLEELRFQSMILEQIQDRVTVTDMKGIISYVNKAESEMMKLPPGKMIGQSVESYGEDPGRGATQKQIVDETTSRGHWRGEVVNYAADGSELILDVRTSILKDNKGQPFGLCGVSTDITGRKHMEEQLRRNLDNLALLLQAGESLAKSLNLPDILQILTETACKLMGMNSSAIYLLEDQSLYLGATTPPLPSDFPESLKHASLQDHPYIQKAVTGKSPVVMENAMEVELSEEERRAVETRNLLTNVYLPLIGTKGVIGVLIISSKEPCHQVQEVQLAQCQTLGTLVSIAIENATLYRSIQNELTQRKQKEEALRHSESLLSLSQQIAHVGTWVLDADKDKLTWSEETYSIFGMDPKEFTAITFDGFLDAVHPGDREAVKTAYTRSLETGADSYEIEHRIIQKNSGEVRFVFERCIHQKNNKGKVIRSVGIVQDITERKKAEKDLITAKEKAEESNRLKTAFLANVSHEIRTPMNAILGFLELLRQPDLEGSEKDEYINIVNKSGQRLLNTINDIIEASKIEAGQTVANLEEVHLEEIMQYHFDLFSRKVTEKGLQLQLNEHLSGSRAIVQSDKHKLDGILTNLLGNAIKFTDEGLIEFGNGIEGDRLVFYVRDTGKGIPDDKLDTIFERFIQGDTSLTRAYEGSGLGLSIVRAYVEILGGRIWVQSRLGQGSTFYFSIPYNSVSIKSDQPAPHEGSPDRVTGDHTILIAEDDELSYKYLEVVLAKSDVTLLKASDGKETIRLLKEHPEVSMILMDIKMPVMDGLDATKEIRTFNRTIPVIAQTAHALQGDKEKAMAAGCNEYLTKPVKYTELRKMINKYLNS